MRPKTTLFIVAAALVLALGCRVATAEPLKIRLSYIVPVSNWATILFAHPGLAHHLGKSYTFEAVHFGGTPELVQAQARGDLEIANYGYSTFPLAVLNAGMTDLRIIADEFEDGGPGYFSDEYLVRKESSIKTVDDLKGKVLATNVIGSGIDIPMRAMLRAHNLQDKRDLTIIEAPNPTMQAMLMDRKVAMYPCPLPFSADPKVRATTRTLFTQRDAFGITEMSFWVARASFIKKHRAALVDFMEDALRAERWYFDPANHKEAVAITAKVTKVPPERYESWLFLKKGQDGDYYRDPNGKPNIQALQSNINKLRGLGFIKTNLDIKNYVDLSVLDAAAKRLN